MFVTCSLQLAGTMSCIVYKQLQQFPLCITNRSSGLANADKLSAWVSHRSATLLRNHLQNKSKCRNLISRTNLLNRYCLKGILQRISVLKHTSVDQNRPFNCFTRDENCVQYTRTPKTNLWINKIYHNLCILFCQHGSRSSIVWIMWWNSTETQYANFISL